MTDNTGEVVTQEDREAMVAYEDARPVPLSGGFRAVVLAGGADDDARVQAFARHRLTSTRAQVDGGAEGLEAAIRAAELALFVIRKQNVMPNSSWESGFNSDLALAKAVLEELRARSLAKTDGEEQRVIDGGEG